MKTIVVVPTYNEAENIGAMAEALLRLPVDGLQMLIVDDNSPDGTGELADQLHTAHPERILVLHRSGKLGLGTAYVQGFQRAFEEGADYIVQMDADFSHSPDYVPRFLEKISDQDLIVGSRYAPGGRLDKRWSFGRYLLSWWANGIYVRLILGLRVHDATAGFKVFRSEALKKINPARVRSNGYVFQVEMAYLAEQEGMRILEWPIYFEDRRIGRSKMSISVKFEAAWRVLQIRSRYGALKSNSARVMLLRETV
jgi:dolichol-phosphate mannosyltransferase